MKSKIDKSKIAKFQEEPTYQEKVDKEKEPYLGLNKMTLAKAMRDTKLERDEAESKLSAIKLRYEALQQLLIEALDESDENSFTLTDGWQFVQVVKVGASVIPGQREVFYKWAKDNGQEDMFTINAQTAAAFVRERLEEGQEAPPGISVFLKTNITVKPPRG